MTREQELVDTFIELADTLVADFDIVDLLYTLVIRCAHILDAADAGILLPNAEGHLEVVASTSERSHLIGLLQLDAEQGPCLDAYLTGRLVTVDDIAGTRERWPDFAASAEAVRYESMHAMPLRLREETIGSLNLFRNTGGHLDAADAAAAQGLADIATIGILHRRALDESDSARQHLQHALSSRIVVEQAKGIISQTHRMGMDDAFHHLRDEARRTRRRLTDVASDVVDASSRAAEAEGSTLS